MVNRDLIDRDGKHKEIVGLGWQDIFAEFQVTMVHPSRNVRQAGGEDGMKG